MKTKRQKIYFTKFNLNYEICTIENAYVKINVLISTWPFWLRAPHSGQHRTIQNQLTTTNIEHQNLFVLLNVLFLNVMSVV